MTRGEVQQMMFEMAQQQAAQQHQMALQQQAAAGPANPTHRTHRSPTVSIDYNAIMAKRRAAAKTKQVVVHALVAEVARGIAAEFYEIAAKDDKFFKLWPNARGMDHRCCPEGGGEGSRSSGGDAG